MGLVDDLIRARMGGTAPTGPGAAGSTGGVPNPRTSAPRGYVQPPGVNMAQPGRPSGPMGQSSTAQAVLPAPAPITGQQPAQPAGGAGSGVTINIGGGQGQQRDTPAAQPPAVGGGTAPAPATPQPGGAGQTAAPAPIRLARQPLDHELGFYPDGTQLEVPMGVMTVRGGKGRVALNEQGQQAYRVAKASGIRRFGAHPFAGNPEFPEPPVEPGRQFFNPFASTWGKA